MKTTILKLPPIKFVGITARTNNKSEMDPSQAQIGQTVQNYFQKGLANRIQARMNPGRTLCAYTHYESDFTGDYTYFIGEEITHFHDIEPGFQTLMIPAQTYVKFTSDPGPMPHVCIDLWQKIWAMEAVDLGGRRAYVADFEVYDGRSLDPKKTVLDIYIGVKG